MHGTPVQKNLDCWPTLPIIVQYGGLPTLGPPTPEDEDNIMAALKQSDRVISISLTVSISLLKKLSTIEGAFSELQDLVLLSRDGQPLIMPSAFRWGQRLRRLHSTGIAIPALRQPLYSSSSTNLVDLQLHDTFPPWQLSPVILKNLLSEMTRLRSLSLRFRSTSHYHFPLPTHRDKVVLRVILPFLTHLNYWGRIVYLEGIVAIIDAPSLEDIKITTENPFLGKYKRFIDWIETRRSHRGDILSSEQASESTLSISLMQPGDQTRLKLQALYNLLRVETSSMAQIWFKDEDCLRIGTTRSSARMESSHSRGLLEPLNKFTGKKLSHFGTNHLLMNAVHILQPLETRRQKENRQKENVFHALHKLYIQQPGPRHALLREAVVSFMISRRLSGHPIEVEYEQQCGFIEQREAGIL